MSSFENYLWQPDDQLAWLKVKQGHRIYLDSLVPPSELPNSTLSLPNAAAPQLLDMCNATADFGKISISLVWSQLIGQGGQSWDSHAW